MLASAEGVVVDPLADDVKVEWFPLQDHRQPSDGFGAVDIVAELAAR